MNVYAMLLLSLSLIHSLKVLAVPVISTRIEQKYKLHALNASALHCLSFEYKNHLPLFT